MKDLISRKSAIDALDEQIRQCDKALSAFDISMKDEYAVKVERASLVAFRETLEYMPSAQPDVSDTNVGKMCEYYDLCRNGRDEKKLREELLSAQPERKTGRWKRHYCEDGNPDGWQCDQCGDWFYFGQFKPNFCPVCGADMRGDDHD